MIAMTSGNPVSCVSADALPPDGPLPGLAKRIIELLRVEKNDLVVDLCRHFQPPQAMLEESRPRDQIIAPSPFGERLAFLVLTSGVRMVQMGTLIFGQYPMRYEKVLLRDGFSLFKDSLRQLLAAVFKQLDPAARFLIVDSAPSSDAPLFAEGLRRWKRQHRSPEVIAELMREAGFSAQVERVECLRRVSAAECYAWVESRDWPILDSFPEAELQHGLCELRARYSPERMVDFTSRFDLVLGMKPEALKN
ncbi:MAG TPA: hypothetical protein VKM54_13410 [Myxococcota bacterium]|nr:hypothetical protein [Myxococcota bacterium]